MENVMRYEDVFQLGMLALFLAVFLGRSAWLYSRGIKIFVIGEGKRGFQRFLEMLFMLVLPVWMYTLAAAALGCLLPVAPGFITAYIFESVALKTAGITMISAGFIVFIAALTAFGRSWRIGIDSKTPGALVTGGIFRLTRNPVFLFVDLYFIGTFLVYPNLLFLAFAIACAGGIHFQILQEEAFLSRQYGDTYRDYMKRTRRYV
jgi:protein-S-isoprenylcysteine O-methyltransferase Ste14